MFTWVFCTDPIPANIYLFKSALETLEKDVKYVHMSSTLNKSHTFF